MKKNQAFTAEEESQIFSAAGRTWSYVASDAAQLGPVNVAVAIELVVDAGRIVDIGKLDKGIAKKLGAMDWAGISKLFKKNKSRWY